MSFEAFFRANYQRFFFFALKILGNEEDSRDIVDDAMELLWVKHGDDTVDNWFRFSVSFIRNKCIDRLRHDAVHRHYADFYANVLDHHEEMTYEEEDTRISLMKAAIAELPERTRHILIASYVERKKYREIGQELGISDSAVKKQVAKALKLIRASIAKKTKKTTDGQILWCLFFL